MSFASNLTIKGCLDQLDKQKQAAIAAAGILKGDGSGNVSAADAAALKTLLDKLPAVSPAVGDKIPLTDISGGLAGYSTITDILNVASFAKISTGSYTGTGTVGSANPNSLTFPFLPKFFWIYGYTAWGDMRLIIPSSEDLCLCNPGNLTTSYQKNVGIGKVNLAADSCCSGYTKISGLTISWFSGGSEATADTQYNTSGNEYFYVALT